MYICSCLAVNILETSKSKATDRRLNRGWSGWRQIRAAGSCGRRQQHQQQQQRQRSVVLDDVWVIAPQLLNESVLLLWSRPEVCKPTEHRHQDAQVWFQQQQQRQQRLSGSVNPSKTQGCDKTPMRYRHRATTVLWTTRETALAACSVKTRDTSGHRLPQWPCASTSHASLSVSVSVSVIFGQKSSRLFFFFFTRNRLWVNFLKHLWSWWECLVLSWVRSLQ